MTESRWGVDSFSLTGKVAVISGGAGLYGRHISQALAAAGAHVAIAARDVDACRAAAAELEDAGLSASAHALDLRSQESIVAMRDEVVRTCGSIDILVNNAVARGGGDMAQTTAAQWAATSEVNSLGLFLITQTCGEQMITQRSGVIINIASIYGMVGPDFSIYGQTGMTNPAFYAYDKGGMINFTRYMAAYYAPYGIRANSLSPGSLEHTEPSEFVEIYKSRVYLHRRAGADDIKGPVVFLASDASAYVTGANIPVDGGWTAH